jgi:squalene-hopene/tetraprenyl-beta-curcumene cyclase
MTSADKAVVIILFRDASPKRRFRDVSARHNVCKRDGRVLFPLDIEGGPIVTRSVISLAILTLMAAPARPADVGPDPKEVKEVRDKAIAFLNKSQSADGSFSSKLAGPGVTSLVVAALLRNGVSPSDPVVTKAIAAMEKSIKKDGGIYDKGLANYTTSVAVMAFVDANKDGKYDSIIKNATAFLRKMQYGENVKPEDVKFGGAGYDNTTRPDLSNTQYLIDALVAAGVSKDDPALQNALKFVSRCQNLPGETNDQPFAKKTTEDDRGGFTYTPVDPDESKHKTPDGGLRSLGAMTYGGLKSFLYAGVSKKDPRVQGALGWIRRHYTLDENPGLGTAGLFYYFHTFGKAMDALGEDTFTDSKDKQHEWRKDLFEAIKERQKDDGSFANKGDRVFGVGDPTLATAFALMSLSYCKK